MIFQVDAVVERSEKLETLESRTEQLRGESQIYTEVTRPGRVAQSVRERSGSVVECLTRDRRAVGSSLTGVTALCP